MRHPWALRPYLTVYTDKRKTAAPDVREDASVSKWPRTLFGGLPPSAPSAATPAASCSTRAATGPNTCRTTSPGTTSVQPSGRSHSREEGGDPVAGGCRACSSHSRSELGYSTWD